MKKHSEKWEKQFDFKRRASIESRRKLLSSTDAGSEIARNSIMEIEVFSPNENSDTGPVAQISVERPNYTRGRRRSLPALYMSNTPSPNLPGDKPRLSPGLQKIVRLSAEMSSDDRVNSADSTVGLHSRTPPTANIAGNLATEKPRPNRTRVRRGSLPAISYKPGNQSQGETRAIRVPQLLLVDANLLAQQGIPLVSVNTPPKVNRNKRRGSLPAVNYPNLTNQQNTPKPVQPKTYNLSRRRGSLPAVSLTIPEEAHTLGNYDSNAVTTKKKGISPGLSISREDTLKDSIDELEEEGHHEHDGQYMKDRDNLGSGQVRLSTASSGYDTNGCSPAENSGMGLLVESKPGE